MTAATFETTYRNYPYWPLVDLALRAARAIKTWTGDRLDHEADIAASRPAV